MKTDFEQFDFVHLHLRGRASHWREIKSKKFDRVRRARSAGSLALGSRDGVHHCRKLKRSHSSRHCESYLLFRFEYEKQFGRGVWLTPRGMEKGFVRIPRE